MNPSRANKAAVTPFSAARPAWSGLVIVPKFSRRPEAMLAAIPRVRISASSLRAKIFPTAIAAPNPPIVAVE